jgi:drug/metabolite transporter (DMT)-like permease
MNKNTFTNPENRTLISWLLLSILAMMWGSSFIIIKKSLDAFTPVQIGTVRILAAGLVFLPWIISSRKQFPKEKNNNVFKLYGILFSLFFLSSIQKEKPN